MNESCIEQSWTVNIPRNERVEIKRFGTVNALLIHIDNLKKIDVKTKEGYNNKWDIEYHDKK